MRPPWGRFIGIGALLFALDAGIAGLQNPTSRTSAAGGAALSDEDLLLQEAIARDYHRTDSIVRRRLARNMRFALSERGTGDGALIEEAIDLGMHESDLVVRRRLAQKMALRIQETARSEEPSEPELAAFLEAHPERWTEPARVELVQLYFRDAGRARAGLAALGKRPGPPEVRGDVLPLPSRLPAQSRAELTNLLGADFARQAFELPQGSWSGPVRSTYGSHLVYVLDRSPATLSPLYAVRSEVREGLLAERGRDALRAELAALRWRRDAGGGGETAP